MPTAIVTGASSGIGFEVARLLHLKGYKLVLASRNLERLKQLLRELGEGSGIAVKTDVSRYGDLRQLVERAVETYGEIDVLVNNAGVGLYGPFHEVRPVDIEYVVKVNLVAPMLLSRLVAEHMIERGDGCIVNVSSLAAFTPVPWFAVYGAAKAGLKSFTDTLRLELKRYGVRVIGVYPGYIKTNFFKNMIRTRTASSMEVNVLPSGPELSPRDVAARIVDAIVSGKNGDVYVGILNRLAKEAAVHMPKLSTMFISYFYTRGLRRAGLIKP